MSCSARQSLRNVSSDSNQVPHGLEEHFLRDDTHANPLKLKGRFVQGGGSGPVVLQRFALISGRLCEIQCGGFDVPASIAALSFAGTSNPKPHENHRVASVPLVPALVNARAAMG